MRSSSSCQRILDDFRSVVKSLSSNSTDLFAYWTTIFSSYLRFTRTNDSQYIIFTETIYPEGYGKNSTPFSTQIAIGLGKKKHSWWKMSQLPGLASLA